MKDKYGFRKVQKENQNMETEIIYKKIDKMENIKDYKNFHGVMQTDDELWVSNLTNLLDQRNIKKMDFYQMICKKTGLAENTVRSWFRKKPRKKSSRDYIFMIAVILGLTLKETNRLLDRYGRYRPLYVLDVEDAIFYYFITKNLHLKKTENIYADIQLHSLKYKNYLRKEEYPDEKNLFNNVQNQQVENEFMTQIFRTKIDHANENMEQFHEILLQIIAMSQGQNNRLLDWIDSWVEQYSTSIYEISEEENAKRINATISNIRQNHIHPTRDDLILLGVLGHMDAQTISDLLVCAGMEELYVRNEAEAFIKFALDDLYLNCPSIFRPKNQDENLIEESKISDGLINYLDSDNLLINNSMVRYIWKRSRECSSARRKILDETILFQAFLEIEKGLG